MLLLSIDMTVCCQEIFDIKGGFYGMAQRQFVHTKRTTRNPRMKNETKPGEKSDLDGTQKAVAGELQGDIPVVEQPFLSIAEKLGLTEDKVLSTAAGLLKGGAIRKIGAVVRHRQAGYLHNVMVVWAVPPEKIEEVGKHFSTFPEVTHCYERSPCFNGRYSLFTMVHLHKKEDESLLRKMAEQSGVPDFRVLESIEEFKKKSMEYF
jgi:DNA-binding Lrp family transcriptional regulator